MRFFKPQTAQKIAEAATVYLGVSAITGTASSIFFAAIPAACGADNKEIIKNAKAGFIIGACPVTAPIAVANAIISENFPPSGPRP